MRPRGRLRRVREVGGEPAQSQLEDRDDGAAHRVLLRGGGDCQAWRKISEEETNVEVVIKPLNICPEDICKKEWVPGISSPSPLPFGTQKFQNVYKIENQTR